MKKRSKLVSIFKRKMALRKRKNTLNEDDDTDELSKPCFQISPDVQLKEVPTTGEEYLLTVIKERQNCAEVTHCNIDLSEFSKNQNCFVEEGSRPKLCDKLIPTIEWQNMQVADFSEIHLRVEKLKLKKNYQNVKFSDQLYFLSRWKELFNSTEPTLSTIVGLKSALIDTALEKLTEIINDVEPGKTITHRTGQWIYSLLAGVRHPLLTETQCVLRALAKKCAEIRSRIDPEDENAAEAVAPLNIFICIIGRYFRQLDLADSFND